MRASCKIVSRSRDVWSPILRLGEPNCWWGNLVWLSWNELFVFLPCLHSEEAVDSADGLLNCLHSDWGTWEVKRKTSFGLIEYSCAPRVFPPPAQRSPYLILSRTRTELFDRSILKPQISPFCRFLFRPVCLTQTTRPATSKQITRQPPG